MSFYTSVIRLGDNICFRGIVNGRRKMGRIKYSPYLFHPTNKTTEYTSLEGKHLQRIDFLNIYEANEYVEKYKDVANFQVYGNQQYEYAYIAENYPGDVQWDINQILIAYIDIEVGKAPDGGFAAVENPTAPITAITLNLNDKTYAFGCRAYKPAPGVIYKHCKDEYDLIESFLLLWTSNYPDVITGWNTGFYDIVYIVNRIKKLYGDEKVKKLSPWGQIRTRQVVLMGKQHTAYDLVGIGALDYLELYRKFAPEGTSRESYKLDYICHVELGERKLSYEEYDSLHSLYEKNFQKFMEYNVNDVDLVVKLEKKLKLIQLALTLAYNSKSNYNDIFMQTRMWKNIIYNALWEKKVIIPPKQESVGKDHEFVGAYVKEPQKGKHKWLVSFDFASLYPHLQMGWNLSNETLLEPHEWPFEIREMMQQEISVENLLHKKLDLKALKKHNLGITPNGQLFRNDFQGFMPQILERMFAARSAYKKKMLEAEKAGDKDKEVEYNNMQQNFKVCLNSSFGATGNEHFFMYDLRIAEAITTSGQLSTRFVEKGLNEYLNKLLGTENEDFIVASDTDSVYVVLDKLVDKVFAKKKESGLLTTEEIINFIDKACKTQIEPYINKLCKEITSYCNTYQNKLNMKREKICDYGIITSAKHYIWNVWDSEGVRYEKPKPKYVGLEIVKSSTPEICRKKLKEAVPFILQENQNDLHKFIDKFREEFMELPVSDIAFPRGMNGLKLYKGEGDEVYKKGTPIHVRGCLLYNKLVKDKGLTKNYQFINEGEKIKFIYLKLPNPIREDVIAFPNSLPKEFGLDKYVDKNLQFDKVFITPLKTILDVVGWSTEPQSSLESFFS